MFNKDARVAKGLFFQNEDISGLRQRIQEPTFAKLWEDIKGTADRICEIGGLQFPEDTFTLYYYIRKRMSDLGLACLLTGEEKYKEALQKNLCFLIELDLNDWIGPEYPNRPRTRIYKGKEVYAGELETATLTAGMIMAYEWGYSFLTEELRRNVQTCLKEKAYMLLKNSTLFQSENWVMNHLCVIATSFAQTILILEEDIPFAEDMALVQKALKLWMQKMETDGSYGEGYHYWAYPTNCLFPAVYALKQMKGIELDGIYCMEKVFEWAIYNQVGRYEIKGYEEPVAVAVNAHDSPFLFQMEGPEVLLYANYFKNPLAQWYLKTFLLGNPERPDGLHTTWHVCNSLLFVLYDPSLPSKSPEEICLPKSRVFHDTGFCFIRDSWAGLDQVNGKDVVLQLQSGGGGKARSHQHFDKNSFSLFAKGEYFIADPGHSCYRGEAHHHFDTKTASHNTVTINGCDQLLEFAERGMLHDETKPYTSHQNRAEVIGKAFYDEIEYIASDGRKCYQPYLRAFMRKIWFVKPGYFVIWDRIDGTNQEGSICSGWNLNNIDGNLRLTINDQHIYVSRPRADLSIQFAAPKKVEFAVSDGRLHTAYHILPQMDVEGRSGSAKRIQLQTDQKSLKAVDYVYVLCPVEKGDEIPKITLLEVVGRKDHPEAFQSLKMQVNYKGNEDEFAFQQEDVRFCRKDGAYYTF